MFNVITDAVAGAVRHALATLPSGSVGFRVDPEQVFELANRFDEIADKIQKRIGDEIVFLWVAAPGADQPSIDAANRLTTTSLGEAGLVTRLHKYATELHDAAVSLRSTGRQYGLTDHTEGRRLGAVHS